MKKDKNTTTNPQTTPGIIEVLTQTTNSLDPVQILHYLKSLEQKVDAIALSIENSYRKGQEDILRTVTQETDLIKLAISDIRNDYLRLESEIYAFKQTTQATSIFSKIVAFIKALLNKKGG